MRWCCAPSCPRKLHSKIRGPIGNRSSGHGTGGGDAGHGKGAVTFAQDLQGAVLTRHNFAEYPATKDKPAFRHDDLMVIFRKAENLTRADYWDSEVHVICYDVTVSPQKTSADSVSITFDIAPPHDPTAFKTYIQASAKRTHE